MDPRSELYNTDIRVDSHCIALKSFPWNGKAVTLPTKEVVEGLHSSQCDSLSVS